MAFKVFGTTASAARAFPVCFALGTSLAVFAWGALARSLFLGFLSAIVCLTTATFLKYSNDCFLDGTLSFWLVAGSLAFLFWEQGRFSFFPLLFFAFSMTAACLTKGIAALSLPLATFLYALTSAPRTLLGWIVGICLAFALLLPWWFWADGAQFLHQYWLYSVSGRVHSSGLAEHLGPAMVLWKTYWPWLPFFIAGVCLRFRETGIRHFFKAPLGLAAWHWIVILCAFSVTGHFLEHYLLPLYPLAALFVAIPLERWLAKYEMPVAKGILAIALVAQVLLLLYPGRIHPLRTDPIRNAARELNASCVAGVNTDVLVSTGIAEHWMAVATVNWETPWDADSVTAPFPSPKPGLFLVTEQGVALPVGWRKLSGARLGPYELYEPADSHACRN